MYRERNEIVYNHFAENHGKVDNITDNEKEQKYKDFSNHQLKSELNKLKKDLNATPESIRYISKLLRSGIKLPSPESLKLVSAIFYQIIIFHQTITLQKL